MFAWGLDKGGRWDVLTGVDMQVGAGKRGVLEVGMGVQWGVGRGACSARVVHTCRLAGFAQAEGCMSGHTGNTTGDQSAPIHLGAEGSTATFGPWL